MSYYSSKGDGKHGEHQLKRLVAFKNIKKLIRAVETQLETKTRHKNCTLLHIEMQELHTVALQKNLHLHFLLKLIG